MIQNTAAMNIVPKKPVSMMIAGAAMNTVAIGVPDELLPKLKSTMSVEEITAIREKCRQIPVISLATLSALYKHNPEIDPLTGRKWGTGKVVTFPPQEFLGEPEIDDILCATENTNSECQESDANQADRPNRATRRAAKKAYNRIPSKPLTSVNELYIDSHWEEICDTFRSRVENGEVCIRNTPSTVTDAEYRVTELEKKRVICPIAQLAEDFVYCSIVVAVTISVTERACDCSVEALGEEEALKVSDWYAIDVSFYLGDDDPQMEYYGEKIYSSRNKLKGYNLDENYVPIITKGTYDDEADQILKKYYPEALEKAVAVDGKTLAQRLKLKIVYVCLSSDNSILGMLYFKRGTVYVYDKNTKAYSPMEVESDTILLDAAAIKATPGVTESGVIIHECVHKINHGWFQELQYSVDEDWVSMPYVAEEYESYLPGQNAMREIEIQTRALTVRIQLPRKTLLPEALKHLGNSGIDPYSRNARAYAFETVIGILKKQYGEVSKQSIRNRLADIGNYDELYGVMNFVNKKYSPVHLFPKGACSKNQTWTLGLKTALDAYRRDENFRKLLATGRYVYVQGHFCINDLKYVEAGLDGEPMMTRYGNEHINECCLKFETVYSYDKERYSKDGILHNEAFKRRKSVFLSGKTDADVAKEEGKDLISHAQDARDLHLSLPVDFGDALEALQKRYGMNNEALAYAMGVTPNTITNWRTGKTKISKPHCVAMCLAFQLDLTESMGLLARADQPLGLGKDDHVYSLILQSYYTRSVATVNDMLRDAGYSPLTAATNRKDESYAVN